MRRNGSNAASTSVLKRAFGSVRGAGRALVSLISREKRRGTATVCAFLLLIGGPVTLAVLHEGFPVADATLHARDVWVTSEADLHAGRVNLQIAELNGFAPIFSPDFSAVNVMQDGDDVFVYDAMLGRIERVTPAFASLDQRIEVPTGSNVSYNASVLAVVRQVDGMLWMIDASNALAFDPLVSEPIDEFGAGATAVVSQDGTVFVASPEQGALFSVQGLGGKATKLADIDIKDFELTTVGEAPWVLERGRAVLINGKGEETPLPEGALRVQQPGPARDFVAVATGDALLKVRGVDDIEVIGAEVDRAVTSPTGASAPVALGACVYAAWTGTARYVELCTGEEPTRRDISGVAPGDTGEFRVNRDAIVFNNFMTGDVFLLDEDFRLVDNWEIPTPEDQDTPEGDEETRKQSFAEMYAERTDVNHAPIARADEVGVRPGKITVLPVLDNDTDVDGDVIVIAGTSGIPESAGVLRSIDDGRALLFEPAPDMAGTVSFRYTANDGRPGGVAETTVDITIRPDDLNEAPRPFQAGSTTVEAGGGVTYNVLTNWIDPDGDDLLLVGAEIAGADVVQFTPNGELTYIHRSAELGDKTLTVTVSDGREETASEFHVFVEPSGSLAPIGVPDSAATFPYTYVSVSPLANDLSPSGEPIMLTGVEPLGGEPTIAIDADQGTFDVTAVEAGTYYLKYTTIAGIAEGVGIVRVDVADRPEEALPPIAVPDTAYLRANEPITVSVLANDVSPTGGILGLQSVQVPTGARYTVELLDASLLRISSAQPLTGQESFTYTMSDGASSTVGGVTIVPVPELTRHQAPSARPDSATVRTGDIATIDVLANDFHPDGADFTVDPELIEGELGPDGVAFVADGTVRVQAPSEAGQYTLVYGITDAFGEASTAGITVTVNPVTVDPVTEDVVNQPPVPRQIDTRVYAGGTVTIEIPSSGIDPDGDSITLYSVSGAGLGMISATSSGGFVYQAFEDSGGTDEFTYQVIDAFGASGTGTVRIGVIPRSAIQSPPNAVDDSVMVKPGRTVAVPVLVNDSDPNGYAISLVDPLLEVQDGVTAIADRELVIVEAGLVEGMYGVRYEIVNENGATDNAFITVEVSEDAPDQYPLAVDHVVEWEEAVGQHTIDIDVFEGALNPSGHAEDLLVSLDGVNADAAEVLADGTVRVTLGQQRLSVSYRLTNPTDGLTGEAFLVVPKYMADYPPRLREDIELPQIVQMNKTSEWTLPDIAYAPSGKPIQLTDLTFVTATRSTGEPIAIDGTTLRYTPEYNYRGPSSITFEVTDGTSVDDPEGVSAVLILPITVGDPEYRDYPPSFTAAEILIEAGEAPTTFDLRGASSHPNPSIRNSLAYTGLTGATGSIQAAIAGGELTVSAPFGVQPGEVAELHFNVIYADFVVPGTVTVRVVASTRPLAQATDDAEPEGRSSSTYTIPVLANDFNPFATEGQTLRVTDAVFDGDNIGATVNHTASTVTVTTGSAKSGTINLIYTIRDATNTADREVQGRITVIVASAPEPIASFTLSRGGSGEIRVVFQPPSSSNGAPITVYTVQMTGSPATATRTDCAPGAICSFTGRTNGAPQTVSVAATNKVGTTWSGTQTITPYGTPSVPTGVYISATNSSYATSTITPRWATPSNPGGGAITYDYRWTAGISGTGSTTGLAGSGRSVNVGTYRFEVQACNPGGCSGYASSANKTIYTPPPPPAPYMSVTNPVYRSGYWRATVTLHNYTGTGYQIQCRRSYSSGSSFITVTDSTRTAAGNVSITCLWTSGPYEDFLSVRNATTGDTAGNFLIH